jgi:hypothetical protein
MTHSLLDRQSELPRSVPLFRYVPERVRFSWKDWDPSIVRSGADLPQYLILGNLDPLTFEQSDSGGWSARWQGTEHDTHFEVAYKADTSRWEIRQTWFGLDGGFSLFPARISLDKVIAQALYTQFPRNWDGAAKSQLESAYQVTVVEQPENAYTICGIPDGAFRTIIFPIAVRNLRPMRQWLQDFVDESPLTYPITVEAKLVFQALNYLEGKAPEWTTQEAVAFNQSVVETGLAPQGFPVREVANDGSAAWTLRREIYFLFIGVPFAGLTDFLSRMASANGPIRTAHDPDFRFELRPIVIPAAFELQTESLALWDKARTTRSFLQFALPGEPKDVPTVEDVMEAERTASATLAKVEAISGDVVTAIEQIFQRVTKGGAS